MDEENKEPAVSVQGGGVNPDKAEALSHSDSTPDQPPAEWREQPQTSKPSDKAAFNPFSSGVSASLNPFLAEDKKSYGSVPPPVASGNLKQRKDLSIQVQEFSGWPIPAERFIQLEQAFKQANLDRNTPTWVCQTPENIQVLLNAATGKPVKTPLEAGFQQVSYPFLSMAYRLMAYLSKIFLKCRVTDNMLVMANGAQVSLSAATWLDAYGNPAQLYEVRGLPDGTWLKLSQQCNEECIPLKNQKALRKMVEGKLAKQEEAGKVRESSAPLKLGSGLPGVSMSQTAALSHASQTKKTGGQETQALPIHSPGTLD